MIAREAPAYALGVNLPGVCSALVDLGAELCHLSPHPLATDPTRVQFRNPLIGDGAVGPRHPIQDTAVPAVFGPDGLGHHAAVADVHSSNLPTLAAGARASECMGMGMPEQAQGLPTCDPYSNARHRSAIPLSRQAEPRKPKRG